MTGLDDALNIIIPVILVGVIVGWLWIKLSPVFVPFFKKMIEGTKNNAQKAKDKMVRKEIVYE